MVIFHQMLQKEEQRKMENMFKRFINYNPVKDVYI